MVSEEKQANGHANGAADASSQISAKVPEEPPKMEDIVTPALLQNIVQGYNKNMKLVSYHAESGSQVGDGYMSIMFAVDITLEDPKGNKQSLKVMVKTVPRNELRLDMSNDLKAFVKEACLYKEILPQYRKIQVEKGVPKSLRFESWPECYATYIDTATDYLAMENLKPEGFKMGNRKEGLDFNHSSFVLQNLARFHACCYAVYGGNQKLILEKHPALKGGIFDTQIKSYEMNKQFYSGSCKTQAVNQREMGEELVASRLDKLGDIDLITLIGDLIEKDIEIAVVTHGDCWVNNFLFAYDEEDTACRFPTKLKFLDFQLSTASSRFIDIWYFMMTSVNPNVLKKYEEDLLRIYYAEFTSFSHLLGVDTETSRLTWDAFVKEAEHFRFHGVIMGVVAAPFMAAHAADVPDMDSYTSDDAKNPEETMKEFLNQISKEGAARKIKSMILDYLPKCVGYERFL